MGSIYTPGNSSRRWVTVYSTGGVVTASDEMLQTKVEAFTVNAITPSQELALRSGIFQRLKDYRDFGGHVEGILRILYSRS